MHIQKIFRNFLRGILQSLRFISLCFQENDFEVNKISRILTTQLMDTSWEKSWWWRGWDCERTTHSGLFRRLENPSQWSGMCVLYLQPITYILKIIQQCLINKTVHFLGLFFTIHLRHSNNMNLWENTEYNFKCPEFSNKIANTNIGVLCLCIYVKSGNRCYIFSKIFNMDDNILILKPRKKKKNRDRR